MCRQQHQWYEVTFHLFIFSSVVFRDDTKIYWLNAIVELHVCIVYYVAYIYMYTVYVVKYFDDASGWKHSNWRFFTGSRSVFRLVAAIRYLILILKCLCMIHDYLSFFFLLFPAKFVSAYDRLLLFPFRNEPFLWYEWCLSYVLEDAHTWRQARTRSNQKSYRARAMRTHTHHTHALSCHSTDISD